MLLSPDFTKQEPCCKQDNDARVVFREGQVISFDSPVYGDTIDITTIATIPKKFVRGTDWDVHELDEDTLSRMKLEQPKFDAEIVKSIIVKKAITDGAQLKIAMTYQRVYPLVSQKILLNDQPVVWTADLAKEVLMDISYLKALTHPVTSIYGVPDAPSPRLLEEDPHKENPDNIVRDEIHAINVPNDKMFVHPVAGSFFKDSVKVEFVREEGNKLLVEGEDYVITGLDRARTATTTNKDGVYTFIFFIQPYVGEISLTYHAYGGDVTLYDQRAVEETINNIINHLNGVNAVTPENLHAVGSFQTLSHHVFHLEESMRRLTKEGKANYGDVTSGMTLRKKLVAKDSETHWWTIASLYKVDTFEGESEVQIADEFHFRLTTLNSKMMFNCVVDVNLEREDRVMTVAMVNDCCPKGFVPFKKYDNLELIPRPQLRVIYNDNDQMNSGVYLQIGMKLTGLYEEVIAVEDLSGKESCWKLVNTETEDETTGNYQDNVVTLPNPAHVWDKLNPDSKYESTLVPFRHGHLVWAGSESINRPNVGKVTLNLDHFLDDDIDISTISKARIEFEEAGGHRFAEEMEFIDGEETKVGNVSFFYNGSPAYANIYIERTLEDGKLNITLEANTDAGLSGNKLDVRHLYLFS